MGGGGGREGKGFGRVPRHACLGKKEKEFSGTEKGSIAAC